MRGHRLHLFVVLLALSAPAVTTGKAGMTSTIRVTVLHREPIAARERRPPRVVPWTLESQLTGNDFEVLSGDVPCSIRSVAKADEPLSLALVLDVSNSSQLRYDHVLASVKKIFVPALKPSDRVCIVRIGGTQGVVNVPLKVAGSDVVKAAETLLSPARGHLQVGNLGFGYGPSPIWDAVDAALTELDGAHGTRGVVVLTDGRATGNRHGLDEVIGRAIETGVPVHVVGAVVPRLLRQDGSTAARVRPKVYIQEMADLTGGVYIDLFGAEPFSAAGPNTSTSARNATNALVPLVANMPTLMWPQDERTIVHWVGRSLMHATEALRASYVLEISCPTSLTGPHLLNIRAKRPGLEVRAPRTIVN